MKNGGSNIDYNVEITEFTNRALGIHPGMELYCVQYGMDVHNEGETLDIITAQRYGSLYSTEREYHGRLHQGHWEYIYEGEITYPYLICTGNHHNLLHSGDSDLAYIITYPPTGEWTEEKQNAVWCTPFAQERGKEGPISEEGKAIYEEAVKYKEFFEQTSKAEGATPENHSIDVKDETEKNKITIKSNHEEQTLTIGPLSVDYIYGAYGDVAFGGISDMYMVGYNSKGEIIKNRIEILKYVNPEGTVYKPEYFEPNQEDNSFVDYTPQVYPKGKTAGEETFQLMIKNPNAGLPEDANEDKYVSSVKIRIKFKWMGVTSAEICVMDAYKYQVVRDDEHTYHCHHICNSYCKKYGCTHSYCGGDCCYYCYGYTYLHPIPVQDHANVLHGGRTLYEEEIELDTGDIPLKLTMDLGGKVWEDMPGGKENIANGQYDKNERVIPNVKVTLYTENGKIATLLSNAANAKSDEQIMSSVNPTYTDKNGDYLFKGINPQKKYYVTFEYNGQIYLPTDYLKANGKEYNSIKQMVNLGLYNYSNEWEITSKGTETPSDRKKYDEKFSEIGSSPLNYVSSNSLNSGALINGYNESFSKYELMGFEMTENGDYKQGTRLIDGFYTLERGNIVETEKLQEGEISKAIKEFIIKNRKSPTKEDMLNIYGNIAGKDKTLWKKLQFIEDCKIQSYTQAQGAKHDLYPVYENFIINRTIDMVYNTAEEARKQNYNTTSETIDGQIYKAIYPGQFYINQGLWKRQETDLALRKDVAYAATRINGKTEIYKYDKRANMTESEKAELARLRKIYEEDRTNKENYQKYLDYLAKIEGKYYWEIQLRMRDYNNYYASNYTREFYPSDYNYRNDSTNKSGKDLELYVTYKITIRNSSTSILNEITEVVDYYDKDYTYLDNLSWVMYKENSNDDNTEISVSEEDYRQTMHNLSFQGNLKKNAKDTDASYSKNSNGKSRYGTVSQSDMEDQYNSVYIKGLEGKKLSSGEEAYIYLTFRVKENSQGIILDDGTHGNDSTLKQNYVEINGYRTYYRDGTKLPNNQTMSDRDVAGLIDIDSNPGNLCLDDLKGKKYEKNFEDDTDRAKSIKVTLDDDASRKINGTVWEDERTQNVSDSRIGDGVRTNKEIGINGVTVEVVEKLEAGGEYVWQTTQSGSGTGKRRNLKTGQWEDYTYKKQNGYYEFAENITGNYIVRFKYGDKTQTVQTNANGGSNTVSYNGQDFKSTVYQKDIKNNKELAGYKEEYYNIQASDSFGANLSDAKDLWEDQQRSINWENTTLSGRKQTNEYSTNNVTNHKAEVLASPYNTPKDNKLIQELIDNTNMTAETGIIVLEGEYDRQKTDGDNAVSNGKDIYKYENDKNGNYTLNNVDFGLTERPKAGLELGKKVTNVKVTLANGNTLFDATKSVTDLNWNPRNSPYETEKGKKNNIYETYYGKDHRYAYRNEITKLINNKIFDSSHNNGLIQITMDDELMHGATIRVTYELTVANVGEVDYIGEEFYYKGTQTNTKVTTAANIVTDYVANNLQFRQTDNDNWKTTSASNEGVHNNVVNSAKKYNTIIKTGSLSKSLKPGENTKTGLILTQLVTAENNADDRTYNNIAEITTISNTVGRRMAFSVQGNQDPASEVPSEIDSAKSEQIVILPPFGVGNIVMYITIAIGTLAVLTTGIILIKKKILKK